MRLVRVEFDSGRDFLNRFSSGFTGGVLACRPGVDLELDEAAVLDILFPGLPDRVLLPGQVVGRTSDGEELIQLSPRHFRTRDYLLRAARGHVDQGTARHHCRFPVDWPARCRTPGGVRFEARALDVSLAGAFLGTGARLSPGAALEVDMVPPGVPASTLPAQVVRSQGSPALQYPELGLGVRFEPNDPRTGAWRSYLRRLDDEGRGLSAW